MNQDEILSLVRKLMIAGLSALATKLHLDANTGLAIATDLADAAVLVWGVYEHRGMKKVPEAAKIVVPGDRRAA
jgi:hypothetical protein